MLLLKFLLSNCHLIRVDSFQFQLQNEQSVTLKVTNLEPNNTRAIYKNISVDLRRFKNLKMFL